MPENKDNEERKNEFIDAAEKLFKENGIVETTISSIEQKDYSTITSNQKMM